MNATDTVAISERIIRRAQVSVMSMAQGFFESSTLFALTKLKVFQRIDEGKTNLNELAEDINIQPETLSRLMNAGVVLKLLKSDDGVSFSLDPVYRAVLSPSGGEYYIGDLLKSFSFIQTALTKLDMAVLHSGPTIDPSTHIGGDRESTREFILGFHNYASLPGRELAHFLSTEGSKSLLDVGCGPGTYAFNLGMRNSELDLYLLDRSEILEIAREVQGKYALKNNVHYLPFDATKDTVPGSYDMILVSNLLVGLGEDESRNLIGRLYGSLNKGGSLVVQAQYLRDDRLGERWPVFLDLEILCTTQRGRNHTVKETRRWLEEAGFTRVEFCPMTIFNVNSYLRGFKP
jgi:SAM-dependent methyltransferase